MLIRQIGMLKLNKRNGVPANMFVVIELAENTKKYYKILAKTNFCLLQYLSVCVIVIIV